MVPTDTSRWQRHFNNETSVSQYRVSAKPRYNVCNALPNGGSRLWAVKGTTFYSGARPLEGIIILCFPVGLSHVYFFVGGSKVYSQAGWGTWPDLFLLDPPLALSTFSRLWLEHCVAKSGSILTLSIDCAVRSHRPEQFIYTDQHESLEWWSSLQRSRFSRPLTVPTYIRAHCASISGQPGMSWITKSRHPWRYTDFSLQH